MNYNLKNRPRGISLACMYDLWLEHFETELRERAKMLRATLEYRESKYDMARYSLIQEILGEAWTQQ